MPAAIGRTGACTYQHRAAHRPLAVAHAFWITISLSRATHRLRPVPRPGTHARIQLPGERARPGHPRRPRRFVRCTCWASSPLGAREKACVVCWLAHMASTVAGPTTASGAQAERVPSHPLSPPPSLAAARSCSACGRARGQGPGGTHDPRPAWPACTPPIPPAPAAAAAGTPHRAGVACASAGRRPARARLPAPRAAARTLGQGLHRHRAPLSSNAHKATCCLALILATPPPSPPPHCYHPSPLRLALSPSPQ